MKSKSMWENNFLSDEKTVWDAFKDNGFPFSYIFL